MKNKMFKDVCGKNATIVDAAQVLALLGEAGKLMETAQRLIASEPDLGLEGAIDSLIQQAEARIDVVCEVTCDKLNQLAREGEE